MKNLVRNIRKGYVDRQALPDESVLSQLFCVKVVDDKMLNMLLYSRKFVENQ